jgi:hypothetical protein
MKQPSFFPLHLSALFAALILVLSGCGSGGAIPRDLMADEARGDTGERPVAMRGEAVLLDGKLAAFATISRGFDRGVPGGRGDGGNRRKRPDDGFSQNFPTGFGDSEEDQKAAMEEYIRMAKARRAAGSPMPPVTLRVLFENRGTEPMELEVTEVNSDLGNFAVRPPKLTLAPGENGTLEPMISQLGVTSDEIPLKLAVRVGAKKDSQVVAVKNVLAPALRK